MPALERSLRRPRLLKPGDRVQVVATSGPVNRERFLAGIHRLHEIGLEPVYDDSVFARTAYLAGSDELRQAKFSAALADSTAPAIWCARGGYGATQLLPALMPQEIANLPRWFIGFSDATALHALWNRAGVQSLHAANMTGLADWTVASRELLQEWLFQGTLSATLCGTPVWGEQVVSGPVIGGNLTVFAAMTGTGQLPDLSGAIVFFEDVGERPYRLDRCLTQLNQAGVFSAVAGFAIGQLTGCNDPPSQANRCSALDAIRQVLLPLRVPIVAELPVGHEASSLPLPFGALARLDPATGELCFVG